MAGYSGTPLVKKLGLRPKDYGLVVHAPQHYTGLLDELPEDVRLDSSWPHERRAPSQLYDFIHYFSSDRDTLEADFAALKAALKPDGKLWISWPKGTSRIPTDLNENLVRKIGLDQGLVDVKIAAVDEDWSALKFVYRVKDRP